MLYLHIDLGLKVAVKKEKVKDKNIRRVFNFLHKKIIVDLYWVTIFSCYCLILSMK